MSLSGNEVVIVAAARTPIGRGHPGKGIYKDSHPSHLLAAVYKEVISRAGIEPALVGDVIVGCVNQQGEQGFNVGRNAWLEAGLPMETPATTIDRQCGSAQQAVNFAASLIASGIHDVVLGGGVEHMGHVPINALEKSEEFFGHALTPELLERYRIVGQGHGAEMIAEEYGVSRTECDEIAVLSQRRAAIASENGEFEREIVPFAVDGETHSTDQGVRPDTSLEGLAALRPAFKTDGRHTAGNSSQISDGAAAVLLMSAQQASELGVTPRARIKDHLTVGCDPVKMLEGPIPATTAILERNGLKLNDIDRIEVNEAFAAVIAAWRRVHEPDMDRVNVRGGAIALGHPLGATGARLITSLVHGLEDDDQELGFVTMCCGGGLGTATLIERV